MRVRLVLAAIAVSLGWACASSGGASGGGATASGRGPNTQRISTSRDVIAEAEITSRASEAANAYQVIEKLRPQMLRPRGSSISMSPDSAAVSLTPRVYVDGISFGELNTLANISANQIKEIRFISARDATTQWGTGHMGGVILVVTRK